jgi:hypothetical protein
MRHPCLQFYSVDLQLDMTFCKVNAHTKIIYYSLLSILMSRKSLHFWYLLHQNSCCDVLYNWNLSTRSAQISKQQMQNYEKTKIHTD